MRSSVARGGSAVTIVEPKGDECQECRRLAEYPLEAKPISPEERDYKRRLKRGVER